MVVPVALGVLMVRSKCRESYHFRSLDWHPTSSRVRFGPPISTSSSLLAHCCKLQKIGFIFYRWIILISVSSSPVVMHLGGNPNCESRVSLATHFRFRVFFPSSCMCEHVRGYML
ncbi:Uncharacterized protein M6B38_235570 [Iris pallida]|uniref:Secreted protein n=1 Tax=Iris pallida TaxID=29817 RepID=A0AAX6DPT7_IRIPA|nr:Uncharacterized protein M6B38_235570 [Iris pallida]